MQSKPTASRKEFNVYAIEVKVIDSKVDWNFYVGYTERTLDQRWLTYTELGRSVSKFFRNDRVHALAYRKDLMKGWGPYDTKDEALIAEGDFALHLKDRGYRVYSDMLKKAEQRRAEGTALMQPRPTGL